MKLIFDELSHRCSKLITRRYSTSFSLGIHLLAREYHKPIYGIYGFVRLADEIVDSFHDFDKHQLLDEFEAATYQAIDRGISLNPVLNSFQDAVRSYHIERTLIETFLQSMRMDLKDRAYDREQFEVYILGSAEVVGLMCLRVFCNGNEEQYNALKPAAMKLGAAFQKVNFLRDVKDDFEVLGRTYFPGVDLRKMDAQDKVRIEQEIARDFAEALAGIRQLPKGARRGVYVAYVYYKKLFDKISSVPTSAILERRVRIPNSRKFTLLVSSLFKLHMRSF